MRILLFALLLVACSDGPPEPPPPPDPMKGYKTIKLGDCEYVKFNSYGAT